MVLVQMASFVHAMGFAKWSLTKNKKLPSVCFEIFYPLLFQSSGLSDTIEWALLKQALADMENTGRFAGVSLSSESEEFAKEYGSWLGLPIHVFPVPVHPDFGTFPEKKKTSPFILFFPAMARLEKGFDWFPGLIQYLKEELASGQVRLVLQATLHQSDVELFKIIRKMEECHGVELLKEPLSPEEYQGRFQQADLNLFPFRKDKYAFRGSCTCAESISAGIPMVVTGGTWMANQMKHYGAGVTFDSNNPEAFNQAVRHALQNLDALKKQAQQKRQQYTLFHNASKLIEILFASSKELNSSLQNPENIPNHSLVERLKKLIPQVIQKCRIKNVHRVAIYGAGEHTRLLLPLWKENEGPEIVCLLESEAPKEDLFLGIPVFSIRELKASRVHGVVLSSFQFEQQMTETLKRMHPRIQTFPVWNHFD